MQSTYILRISIHTCFSFDLFELGMYKNVTKTITESNQTFKPQESEMVV